MQAADLNTYSSNGLKVSWSLVLEVIWVCNLAWLPHSLVQWVVNERSRPLALVGRVLDHWLLPWATSRNFLTLGVRDLWCEPIAVLLVIPIFWLGGLWVWDGQWLALQPVFWLLGGLVNDLVWSILIPVFWFGGFWVHNLGLVDPSLRLLVVLVIDLGRWVDGRGEVLEESAVLGRLAVNQNLEGLVWANNESVQVGELVDLGRWGCVHVLLLVLASLGVLVLEDEVNLVGGATLVRTEHDHVWRGIGELVLGQSGVLAEELQISTTTLEVVLKLDFILNHERLVLVVNGCVELGGDGVVSSLVLEHKTLITLEALEDGGLLDLPVANVLPLLLGVLLLCVRCLPPRIPAVCELFHEGSLQCGGL